MAELSWLLSRGYASPSALKLVGDRYQLKLRQRQAVLRCACSDEAMNQRLATLEPLSAIRNQTIWLDGYNVLTTVEAALGSAMVLIGRDGVARDLQSVHGTYRKVAQTRPAAIAIGRVLADAGAAEVRWLLDQPVSNSGRLKTALVDIATEHQWPWHVELAPDPDAMLGEQTQLIASADSVVLDAAHRWVNLAREVVAIAAPRPWVINFAGTTAH